MLDASVCVPTPTIQFDIKHVINSQLIFTSGYARLILFSALAAPGMLFRKFLMHRI